MYLCGINWALTLKDRLQDEEDHKMTYMYILLLSFGRKDKVGVIDHEKIKMMTASGSLLLLREEFFPLKSIFIVINVPTFHFQRFQKR